MQIVIDIPERVTADISNVFTQSTEISKYTIANILNAIANGTVLPKGHGRLIDADKLPMDLNWCDIEKALTVLEADNPCKNCRRDGEYCMTCEYE